jgi:hypothetical protein
MALAPRLGLLERLGLRRGRPLPDGYRPALDRDERVVAWAVTGPAGGPAAGGAAGPAAGAAVREPGVLVATDQGLWLPGKPPARLGWHEIHRAVWTGDSLEVTAARVVERSPGYVVVADLPTVRFQLADPGDLPAQVRGRVTRSVGPSSHHPLPGAGGVRVVARRVPGVDGLTWTARYDRGVDHDDPVVREVTADLVNQARAGVSEVLGP